jgi:hypothetical protein
MLRFPIAAAILFCTPAIAQVANAPCWEANLGTNLGLGDDVVSGPQALGFTFPGPGGPVTSIWVASNGFVWMAANTNSRCCDGDPLQFVTDPASIAGMWVDLYPPGGTGVFFNAIPATTSAPARGVITWQAVPEYGGTPIETVQMQLLSTGEIVISHEGANGIDPNTGHTALMGVTQGGGATANTIDFHALSGGAANTGTNPTVFEVFDTSTFDVAGRSYEFIPNGTGGYLVLERTTCRAATATKYGSGCPRNGTVYEAFVDNVDLANSSVRFLRTGSGYVTIPGNGFDNSYASAVVGVGDDSIHQGLALGFSFPFEGTTITTVDLSSNGYLWAATNSSSIYYPAIVDFLSQDRRIAPYWRDLYVPGGGALYWDTTPTFAMATWVGVPNYPNTGPPNTVQVKLYATGDIEFNYGALDPLNPVTSDITVVGFTEGNGAADPGSVDLSATLPGLTVGTAGSIPLALDPAPGSLPHIGSAFQMDVSSIPASASLGFMLLSLGQSPLGFDLSPFGLPMGCTGYVVLAAASTQAFLVTPPTGQFMFNIPNNAGLVPLDVYAQVAVLPVPGAPVPAIVSNGLVVSVGR